MSPGCGKIEADPANPTLLRPLLLAKFEDSFSDAGD